MELAGSEWSHTISNGVTAGSNALVPNDCEQMAGICSWETFEVHFWRQMLWIGKKGSLYSSLPPGRIPGVPDGAVILILGNIFGLNDAPQRWWKNFDAVMTSIGFTRSTCDVCV